jgi:hypothetical protein
MMLAAGNKLETFRVVSAGGACRQNPELADGGISR